MKKVFALSLVALMGFSACSGNVNSYRAQLINRPDKIFNTNKQDLDPSYLSSIKAFSNSFFQAINDGNNQIFSPLSIATCFSMLYDGAKAGSKEELATLLNYDDSYDHLTTIQKMLLNNAINTNKPEVILDISQSFWADNLFKSELKQAYIDKLTNFYFAEAMQGDLESDEMHNALADYINEKTRHFFDLKGEDFKDYAGVVWLLNTIYLKSPWAEPFYEIDNFEGSFSNLGKPESTLTYMTNEIDGYCYEQPDYRIASIPLKGGLNLNILLPNENSNYQAILDNANNITKLLDYPSAHFDKKEAIINYQLPKFKLMKDYNLKDIFIELGVEQIFSEKDANLGDIYLDQTGNKLFVGKAKHQAGIDVNNYGVEAAAYTIIEMEITSYPIKEEINFFVNRPFVYTISDRDSLPLFMGVVTNLS